MYIFKYFKATTSVALIASFIVLISAPGPLRADLTQSPQTKSATKQPEEKMHRLIVKFKDDATLISNVQEAPSGHDRVSALSATDVQSKGGKTGLTLSYLKSVNPQTHVITSNQALTRSEMTALTQEIAKDPRVEYAEIDERMFAQFVPNDTNYAAQQWSMKAPAKEAGGANLPNAWGRTAGGLPISGSGVTVAVLDTGYRPHADLAANVLPGYDFISADPDSTFTTANDGDGRDGDATDPGNWNTDAAKCEVRGSSWHGTRVAGIIAAVGNNNAGVIGVAYGAKILPVRVLGVCSGSEADVAAGIRWAAGLPVPGAPLNTQIAKIINLSLGSHSTCSATIQAEITAAHIAGSVVVVSTGNETDVTISSPANCTGVIAVTAHTRLGDKADYANVGAGTTISAPGGGYGTNISGDGRSTYSTSNSGATMPFTDSFAYGNGTSFSAPHVSGVAALLFQIKPTITPDDVKTYLTTTARAFPAGTYCADFSDSRCGTGMLDGFKAVSALLASMGTVNTAPTMNTIAPQTVAAGGYLQFNVTGADVNGDTVTFLASGVPASAVFDADTGAFTWVSALPGVYSVTITPTDGALNGTAQTVSVTVTGSLPAAATTTSSGGGGGAANGADLIALLLLAGGATLLRRRDALPPVTSRS